MGSKGLLFLLMDSLTSLIDTNRYLNPLHRPRIILNFAKRGAFGIRIVSWIDSQDQSNYVTNDIPFGLYKLGVTVLVHKLG